MEILFFLVILIFSIIIHEVSHGYVAEMLGDKTARLAGRLTLNPAPHIDPLGSILVPAVMLFGSAGQFAFGWAKPVPFNPYNLRNVRWGTLAVSIAGVAANLLIAIIFGLLIRFHQEFGITSLSFLQIIATIVQLNLVLVIFNMIPVPPLDGAKVLFTLLPQRFQYIHDFLERNWMIFIVFVIILAHYIIWPITTFLFGVITGLNM
ncbi:MAG: site-2 protease family protein [Patescibacteria group bacterium]